MTKDLLDELQATVSVVVGAVPDSRLLLPRPRLQVLLPGHQSRPHAHGAGHCGAEFRDHRQHRPRRHANCIHRREMILQSLFNASSRKYPVDM